MNRRLSYLQTIYKGTLSFVLKLLFGGGCRYEPTCSQFAKESIDKFGVFKGTALSLRRLSRCHPWGGMGYDPVPQKS